MSTNPNPNEAEILDRNYIDWEIENWKIGYVKYYSVFPIILFLAMATFMGLCFVFGINKIDTKWGIALIIFPFTSLIFTILYLLNKYVINPHLKSLSKYLPIELRSLVFSKKNIMNTSIIKKLYEMTKDRKNKLENLMYRFIFFIFAAIFSLPFLNLFIPNFSLNWLGFAVVSSAGCAFILYISSLKFEILQQNHLYNLCAATLSNMDIINENEVIEDKEVQEMRSNILEISNNLRGSSPYSISIEILHLFTITFLVNGIVYFVWLIYENIEEKDIKDCIKACVQNFM